MNNKQKIEAVQRLFKAANLEGKANLLKELVEAMQFINGNSPAVKELTELYNILLDYVLGMENILF